MLPILSLKEMSKILAKNNISRVSRTIFSHFKASQQYQPVLNQPRMTCTNNSQSHNPIENSIRQKLQTGFQPEVLEVLNESYMHSVPKGSETHFKVVVVSKQFENLTPIKRHRLVNETLQEELNGGVHALSIVAKTPKQWEDSGQVIGKSPPCMGGAGL